MNSDPSVTYKVRSWQLLIFILGYLACTLPWLGWTDFHTRGEGREALVALSMWQSGNFILPEGYGGDIPSKPPFLHWCVALFSAIAGMNEWACRVPSLIASALFLFGFGRLLAPRFGVLPTFVALFGLATAPEWARHAVVCRVDMLHSAALAGALVFGFLHDEGRSSRRFLVPICLTAAVLSKGPVGVALPGVIFLAWWLLNRRSFTVIFSRLVLYLVPPFLCSAAWYGAAYFVGGEQFWDKVFAENFGRLAGSMEGDPHSHGVTYLLGTLVLGSFTLWGVPLLAWGGGLSPVAAVVKKREPLLRFSVLAAGFIVAFYCIPDSKRGVYLLGAYPFLAVIAAAFVPDTSEVMLTRLRAIARYGVFGICGLTLLIGIARLVAWGRVGEFGFGAIGAGGVLQVSAWIIITLGLLSAAIYFRRRTSWVVIPLFVWSFLAVSMTMVFPGLGYVESDKRIAKSVHSHVASCDRLYSYNAEFYGVSFYLQRPINRLPEPLVLPLVEDKLCVSQSQSQPATAHTRVIVKEQDQDELVDLVSKGTIYTLSEPSSITRQQGDTVSTGSKPNVILYDLRATGSS